MKTEPEVGIMMPQPAEDSSASASAARRRWDLAAAALRAACVASSLVSLSLMVTSEQRGNLSLFGLEIPLHSNWSFSDSLQYLVGVSAAVAAYELVQLVMMARKLLSKGTSVRSRGHTWMLFVCDQVFAYAMVSAGSAAAGVSNLNRVGIQHTALPNFCKPLPRFCNHMAISITFAFLSFLFLAISAVLDVVWLVSY
ncbi:putative CASP-like protein 3A1 [Iris pallida]|uniref:CASP-like protein n=1 Tax=Iris pallida TaxID=29817 RepID=A0AAX6GNM1_IRIPA|nr:putative CASP-like protein 3A1 [Iris pallida]KAJ6830379.1 putative CASP-like protein 3A1 [Iris pallida]